MFFNQSFYTSEEITYIVHKKKNISVLLYVLVPYTKLIITWVHVFLCAGALRVVELQNAFDVVAQL